MHETHGRLVAIMFVQITESSDNVWDHPVVSILSIEEIQIFCSHVKSYHGVVVDIRAGELFAHFPGAVVAFNAAMSLHQIMPQFNLRIGLHLGEVPFRKGRYQGADVNLASRLPGCARAGGVCLTQMIYQYLHESDRQKLITLGGHELKNFDTGISLYACLPAGQACRRKSRERSRRMINAVRKYHRFALLLCLTSATTVMAWSYINNAALLEQDVIQLYLPGFEQHGNHGKGNKISDSIEMTIRSRLSALDKLQLTDSRSSAQFELLFKLDDPPGKIRIEYILNYLPGSLMLTAGVIEGEEKQIFQLQDRLSEQVFLLFHRHKIIHSTVASFSVKSKLDER